MRPLYIFILLTLTLLGMQAHSKEVLVLFPVEVSASDADLASDFGSALQEGLQSRYEVYYGPAVEAELEKATVDFIYPRQMERGELFTSYVAYIELLGREVDQQLLDAANGPPQTNLRPQCEINRDRHLPPTLQHLAHSHHQFHHHHQVPRLTLHRMGLLDGRMFFHFVEFFHSSHIILRYQLDKI